MCGRDHITVNKAINFAPSAPDARAAPVMAALRAFRKFMTSTFRNLLISVILISIPIQFVCAQEELTEEKSLSILIAQIKKDKLYDSFSQNLKCISFHTEEQTKEYFAFALREKHGGQCEGDPNTAPIVDRYRVTKKNSDILLYDPIEGDFVPYNSNIKSNM